MTASVGFRPEAISTPIVRSRADLVSEPNRLFPIANHPEPTKPSFLKINVFDEW